MRSALDEFINADWKGQILPRLTLFTAKLVRQYTWSSPGSLPKGLEIGDIVTGAIQKTLEGLRGEEIGKGVRKWDPEKCPELLYYLMGVVRSDISALAKSHDHQKTDRPDEDLSLEDPSYDLVILHPAEAESGRYEEMVARLRSDMKGDKEAEQVLLATEELVAAEETPTAEAISALTGFSYAQVRNARRRLLTAIKAREGSQKGGHKNEKRRKEIQGIL